MFVILTRYEGNYCKRVNWDKIESYAVLPAVQCMTFLVCKSTSEKFVILGILDITIYSYYEKPKRPQPEPF